MSIRCEPLARPTYFERRRLRAIYHANFAPALRKPFGYVLNRVRDADFLLLAARDAAARDRIVSFALLAHLETTAALYLGYLATDPARHSQGIGGVLFEYLRAYAAALPGIDAVVWEVEAPVTDDPAHVSSRRIRFYERHGAHLVTRAASYRIPDDTTGGTLPQRLMWAPVGARTHAPDRDEVAGWVQAIFSDVYEDYTGLAAQIIAALD